MQPSVLETEAHASWNFSRGCGEQRDMIRGKTGERGKGGVRKRVFPVYINKASIKVNKGGMVSFIAPSVGSVQQGNFNEPKSVYSVVKEMGFRSVEGRVVLVLGRTSEIEITNDNPRVINSSGDRREFSKESWFVSMARGRINIGE